MTNRSSIYSPICHFGKGEAQTGNSFYSITGQLPIQGAYPDSKYSGSLGLVPLAMVEYLNDIFFLHFTERDIFLIAV